MLFRRHQPEAYDHMLRGAARLVAGSGDRRSPPPGSTGSVTQVGARVEFLTCPAPPRNGGEAKAALHPELEAAIHLFLAESRDFAGAVPQYDVGEPRDRRRPDRPARRRLCRLRARVEGVVGRCRSHRAR